MSHDEKHKNADNISIGIEAARAASEHALKNDRYGLKAARYIGSRFGLFGKMANFATSDNKEKTGLQIVATGAVALGLTFVGSPAFVTFGVTLGVSYLAGKAYDHWSGNRSGVSATPNGGVADTYATPDGFDGGATAPGSGGANRDAISSSIGNNAPSNRGPNRGSSSSNGGRDDIPGRNSGGSNRWGGDPHGPHPSSSGENSNSSSSSNNNGGWGGGCPPIVVDLDDDGVELVAVEDSSVRFFSDSDGFKYRSGWAAADDGLLVYDKDNDGNITANDEVSFVEYVIGQHGEAESLRLYDGDSDGVLTDMEALHHFDSNNNGKLDSGDAEFSKFKIWKDADQDGVSFDFPHPSHPPRLRAGEGVNWQENND